MIFHTVSWGENADNLERNKTQAMLASSVELILTGNAAVPLKSRGKNYLQSRILYPAKLQIKWEYNNFHICICQKIYILHAIFKTFWEWLLTKHGRGRCGIQEIVNPTQSSNKGSL